MTAGEPYFRLRAVRVMMTSSEGASSTFSGEVATMDQKSRSLSFLSPFLVRAIFGVAIAIAGAETVAYAQVQVVRAGEDVRVEVKDAGVSDVLGALGATYDLRSDLKADFGQPISGFYSGSPRDVISQLLKRYDFVLKSSDGKLAVTIYGLSKAASNLPAGSAVAGTAVTNPTRVNSPAASGTGPGNTARPPSSAAPNAQPGNLDPMTSGRNAGSTPAADLAAANSITGSPPPPAAPVADISVGGMLGAAARGQVPTSNGPNAPAPPADMGALTRNAASAVQNLAGALQIATTQLGAKK
jgi:hypothetical protein